MQEKVATARLERQVISSMSDFLEKDGFVEIFPPKVVRASGACENIDTLFEVGVDGNPRWFCPENPHPAYLSQTAQLYLEAFTPYLGKVYSIGPSFRAEEGNDNRHLIEFLMLEIEFAGGFKKLLGYIEGAIYKVIEDLLRLPEKVRIMIGVEEKEIERLGKIRPVFPRITYNKTIKLLGLPFGSDISSANEQRLVKRFGNQPLFITHFPNPLFDHGKEIEVEKFFNMDLDASNPKRVLSADLILPFSGEAVGAAQRVWQYDKLKWRLKNSKMFERLSKKGGGLEDFEWYLKRVKEKSVLHSGCGFGIARILKFIKRKDDIKEVVTFPSNQENII
ncbi:MAG: amino acid--tRNA ligase-related protein [Candidatus Paceibacterales bacterium]